MQRNDFYKFVNSKNNTTSKTKNIIVINTIKNYNN